ncbi:hypothetical protein J2Q11_13940 [Tenacibaculum finnmarkense genomovar finnmarkense]|uniref:DUF6932 family protein n=1 Tax=Tenacibaculum finnmarkense TaxID=2781243 RepID=UPI001E5733FC|nr:hypothetical protein [Tenacibaculum finnmarkense]MCD8418831.1 hypothetical protein [Tenacibaculum finnmarkense genomovar finnmarkense]MCG8187125.1 hypothetical protein [Tenacibaculum finnmarkense genomovar finnmarkense]MCG8203698.1 hypothetical protein [Tenacibaculum finnmarkense genomovar finnmarkense]MCG8211175.1 hypothetical protein [Tenacibaculum finnmarkense genomovar finnmarkense]MCG8213920.1 hypothetical protein [Tenacibaculum finnmarkense genomovar finnmarkense]
MKIPNFTNEGKLPTGIHICSGEDFINRFCDIDIRKDFEKPISDIFDYAKERGAVEIFIGGSFITANKSPKDLDCVIVFQKDRYIPNNTEKVNIKGLKFDILFASLESTNLIDSYIKLFSTCRYGSKDIGIIQLDLYDRNKVWEIRHYPDDEDFEIIKRVYNDRSLIDLKEKKGIIVSIHGLLSNAEWNNEIAPIASGDDWIFAPYTYETNKPDLLFRPGKRSKVVDDFREWIYNLQRRFEGDISIIAHSFGTYIIGAYLEGFDNGESPPVSFNSIILSGSILSEKFDWEKYRGLCVGSVYNTIAPNDEFVKFMPTTELKKYIGMSNTFGKAGIEGFEIESPMLNQLSYNILSHTNSIKRDIIETKWMPYLNANRFSFRTEMHEYYKRKYKK